MKIKPIPSMSEAEQQGFWERVLIGSPSQCWEWQAGKANTFGHGALVIQGVVYSAHRVSYILANGQVTPDKPLVCHTCDNPICVNPGHLYCGTQADNMADKMRRGRHDQVKGERHGMSKLKVEDIYRIRELKRSGLTQQAIADEFGVNRSNISMILSGKRWGWLK